MRHEKAAGLLLLARQLAGSAEGLTLDEMAVALGADRRTAERARDALRAVFPQLEEVADGPRKRFRIVGGLDGFMQAPTADELAELHLAADALDAAGAGARAVLLRGLAGKIEASLRAGVRARIAPDLEALLRAEGHALQAGPRPVADAAVLGAIRHALKGGAALRLRYGGVARTVHPWALLYGRNHYLVGPGEANTEPVLWRLDRMDTPTLAGPLRPPPDGWTIAGYAARSFGVFQEEPVDVVLRFAPAAAADAARFMFHPSQAVAWEADGALLVRFTAGGLDEMCNHLFGWGTAVEVLAPEVLRVRMAGTTERVARHHAAR